MMTISHGVRQFCLALTLRRAVGEREREGVCLKFLTIRVTAASKLTKAELWQRVPARE